MAKTATGEVISVEDIVWCAVACYRCDMMIIQWVSSEFMLYIYMVVINNSICPECQLWRMIIQATIGVDIVRTTAGAVIDIVVVVVTCDNIVIVATGVVG